MLERNITITPEIILSKNSNNFPLIFLTTEEKNSDNFLLFTPYDLFSSQIYSSYMVCEISYEDAQNLINGKFTFRSAYLTNKEIFIVELDDSNFEISNVKEFKTELFPENKLPVSGYGIRFDRLIHDRKNVN